MKFKIGDKVYIKKSEINTCGFHSNIILAKYNKYYYDHYGVVVLKIVTSLNIIIYQVEFPNGEDHNYIESDITNERLILEEIEKI